MPLNASGTSIKGYQSLGSTNSVATNRVVIALTASASRPFTPVGYLWVYQFITTPPPRSLLVNRQRLYQPGVILVPAYALQAGYSFGVDVNWDVPGLAWSVQIG